MSFTPTNNNMGGMPDISAKMMPVGHNNNNYESQGMERAVIIGQDGKPIGKVESTPPFDLLTEENRHIIEQRKRQREAQKRKALQQKAPQNKPSASSDFGSILDTVRRDVVGKRFKYITTQKFGTVVSVVDCRLNNDEIELVMSDGFTILFADMESQFVADFFIAEDEFVEQEDESKPEPKLESEIKVESKNIEYKLTKVSNYNSDLPNSPLRDLLSSRKKNPTDVTIDLNIDLVKKDFFNIIDESYENAMDYVIEHVMNNLTIDQVKESIKTKLMLYYKSEENSIINQEFENKDIYKEPETIILEKSQ
jgi:hypothetical protein